MKVNFCDLGAQYKAYEPELKKAMSDVIEKTAFINGPDVKLLEEELSEFTGTHAVTCANGTDALTLAFLVNNIGAGDEVITPPFTFIATAETIALNGAKPVFVDVCEESFNLDPSKLEALITPRTKAIVPVSLYGQPSNMDAINEIAKKHNLVVIEDAAQSFGATYRGKQSCNLSSFATTSFFPAKPLGCYGDGGAVFTQDKEAAEKLRSLRNHGQIKRYQHKYIGLNSRLDTLQAAVLRVKLKHYKDEIQKRNEIAEKYSEALESCVKVPRLQKECTSVWAQYTIRSTDRDGLREKLSEAGIPTAVHYPRPLHLQEAFSYLGYNAGDFPVSEMLASEVMSLPMSSFLKEKDQGEVIRDVKSFS